MKTAEQKLQDTLAKLNEDIGLLAEDVSDIALLLQSGKATAEDLDAAIEARVVLELALADGLALARVARRRARLVARLARLRLEQGLEQGTVTTREEALEHRYERAAQLEARCEHRRAWPHRRRTEDVREADRAAHELHVAVGRS